MSPAVYDTLILSDLHLGSEISRAEQATRMLRENRFRRLILLGDIFSDLNFGRLTKAHWKFLGYIRKLSGMGGRQSRPRVKHGHVAPRWGQSL